MSLFPGDDYDSADFHLLRLQVPTQGSECALLFQYSQQTAFPDYSRALLLWLRLLLLNVRDGRVPHHQLR